MRVKKSNNKDPFAGIVKIQFEWWAGPGHGLRYKGHTVWTAIKDGITIDYNKKSKLIEMCKMDGLKYAVIRNHRKGNRITIMEKNY